VVEKVQNLGKGHQNSYYEDARDARVRIEKSNIGDEGRTSPSLRHWEGDRRNIRSGKSRLADLLLRAGIGELKMEKQQA